VTTTPVDEKSTDHQYIGFHGWQPLVSKALSVGAITTDVDPWEFFETEPTSCWRTQEQEPPAVDGPEVR
jgi:hypothetical protein